MQTLIFLNGKKPKQRIFRKFLNQKCFIIAADGASNYLKRVHVTPNLIIGDLDSIDKDTLHFFSKKNVIVKKVTDQEYTDFEKSLTYCLKKKLDNIIIFGAVDLRADHTLNNFSILKRYCNRLNITFITDEFEIFSINKKIEFKYRTNETVSLLALPKAKKINTTGLRFPLLNEDLEFGVREGTLNQSISDNISVSLSSGNLLLFKKHFL